MRIIMLAAIRCIPPMSFTCTVVFADRQSTPQHCYKSRRYININGSSLSYQSKCQDPGVIVTHDLSPSTHISEIVAKAHQRANIILRCFISNDKRLLLRAFFVYVRPILEYCSVVWSPCIKKILIALKRYNGNLQRDYLA